MKSIATSALLLLLGSVCHAGDMETLQKWMTGSFSSEAQAAADESYYDIRLEMVPIWTERKDGPWLYVEQAAASNLERPYRQRVYKLSKEGDAFRSEVYALPEPLTFAGAWREPKRLDQIGPDDLQLREGCAVILERDGKQRFTGSTVEKQCGSTLRGATYATSEVTVTAEGIDSWDRGFSEADEQVWGAEKGAYLFRRQR